MDEFEKLAHIITDVIWKMRRYKYQTSFVIDMLTVGRDSEQSMEFLDSIISDFEVFNDFCDFLEVANRHYVR